MIDATLLAESISGRPIIYSLATDKPLIGHNAPTLKDFMNHKRAQSTKMICSKKKQKTADVSSSATAILASDPAAGTINLMQLTQVLSVRLLISFQHDASYLCTSRNPTLLCIGRIL